MNGWLEEGTAEYERVWGVLASRVEKVGSLDGWQYLGVQVTPWGDAHRFRLRAGMPGNPFAYNWIEDVTARVAVPS